MATKIETLSSSSQLSTILGKNSVVVIDFHATWCAPCKAIAPAFEQLAAQHASLGKVAFAKCDVDACQEVAQKYSVRSMPTFIILKNGTEVDRISGANRSALTSAVERYAREAKPLHGFANSGKGYKLGTGTESTTAAPSGRVFLRSGQVTRGLPMGARIHELWTTAIAFVGLYLVSLFSIDAINSAANSSFAVGNNPSGPGGDRGPLPSSWGSGGGPGGPGGPPGRRLGTIAGLEGTGE
ncbi:thioredoxin-like protein [Geopyxis carbonaria]|nr:thioredoxin-like protein [Geopyxis carbonaria]